MLTPQKSEAIALRPGDTLVSPEGVRHVIERASFTSDTGYRCQDGFYAFGEIVEHGVFGREGWSFEPAMTRDLAALDVRRRIARRVVA